MQAKFIQFGEIEIDGTRYTKDVVIAGGQIAQRDKTPSRKYAADYGHTPLIGKGVHNRLPVIETVLKRAEALGVELVIVSTPDACKLLSEADPAITNAILQLTC